MPSGRVAKGNAYALAQGKSSDLVETIRPERRIGFKFLPDPFHHNPAIAAFEFAADDPGRDIPDESAKNVAAFQAKKILSGSVEATNRQSEPSAKNPSPIPSRMASTDRFKPSDEKSDKSLARQVLCFRRSIKRFRALA